MANFFDQFDNQPGTVVSPSAPNFFDQFHEGATHPNFGSAGASPIGLETAAGVGKIGEGGFSDFFKRADISLSPDVNNKIAKFKSYFPEGDLRQVTIPASTGGPERSTLIFRKSPQEPFGQFDRDFFKGPELGDLADLAGDLPPIIGQVAATIRMKGSNLLPVLGRLAGGAVAGEAARQAEETARGYGGTLAQGAMRMGMEGAFAAAGGAAMRPIEKAVDLAVGAPLLRIFPEQRQAIQDFEAIGLPRPMPHQIKPRSIAGLLGRQSERFGGTIETYKRSEQDAAINTLNALADRGGADRMPGWVAKGLADEKTRLNGLISRPSMSLGQAGTTTTQEVDRFINGTLRDATNYAYKAARKVEEPTFNLASVLQTANEVEWGIRALAKEDVEATAKAQMSAEMQAAQAASGSGFEASAIPEQVTADAVRGKPIQVSGDPNGKILNIIATLRKIDENPGPVPRPDGGVDMPTDQLLALRAQLWELKTPEPGQLFRNEHRLAAQLYSSITKVLDNPSGGSPEFLSRWGQARQLASDRFDLADRALIVKALKDEAPTQFASRLAQPGQVDNLKLVKLVSPNKAMPELQQAFKSEMLRRPQQITQRLDQFDDETLNMLMGKEDQTALREVASRWQKLDNLGIGTVLERQNQAGQMARELLAGKGTQQIDELERIFGDKTLRAGLIDNIIADAKINVSGREIIDPGKLDALLKGLRQQGLDRILTPQDRKNLETLRIYMKDYVKGMGDVGAGLQAASVASGLRGMTMTAAHTFTEMTFVGRLMTTQFGHSLFYGRSNRQPFNSIELRNLGAALGQIAYDVKTENRSRP